MSKRQGDHLYISIAAGLGAALTLSVMNMLSKLMGAVHDPVEITFWRNLIAVIFLLGGMWYSKNLYLIKTRRLGGQFLRALIGTTGMILSIWSFETLPLTEAITYGFTAPLFVVLLSVPLLGEKVGWRRICASFIGFSGVLVILSHNMDWQNITVSIGVIAALAGAFCNSLVIISLRWLGSTEPTITTVFYFLSFGLIGTSIAMPFIYTQPTAETWSYIIPLGVVGLLSLLLKTESYRRGAAALVAPLSYTMILWASLYDWFIWGQIPGAHVLIGAVIIMGSNLFILMRETRLKIPHKPDA